MKKAVIVIIVGVVLAISVSSYIVLSNRSKENKTNTDSISTEKIDNNLIDDEEIENIEQENAEETTEEKIDTAQSEEKKNNTSSDNSTSSSSQSGGSSNSNSSSSSNNSSSSNSSSSNNTTNQATKNYTVSFNNGTSTTSQTVLENSYATKPSDPTKSGYIFSGWLLNGSAYNFNTRVTSNIELKANWKLDETPEFSDEYLDFKTLSECQNKGMQYTKDYQFACWEVNNKSGIFIGYMLTLTKKNTTPPEDYNWRN